MHEALRANSARLHVQPRTLPCGEKRSAQPAPIVTQTAGCRLQRKPHFVFAFRLEVWARLSILRCPMAVAKPHQQESLIGLLPPGSLEKVHSSLRPRDRERQKDQSSCTTRDAGQPHFRDLAYVCLQLPSSVSSQERSATHAYPYLLTCIHQRLTRLPPPARQDKLSRSARHTSPGGAFHLLQSYPSAACMPVSVLYLFLASIPPISNL